MAPVARERALPEGGRISRRLRGRGAERSAGPLSWPPATRRYRLAKASPLGGDRCGEHQSPHDEALRTAEEHDLAFEARPSTSSISLSPSLRLRRDHLERTGPQRRRRRRRPRSPPRARREDHRATAAWSAPRPSRPPSSRRGSSTATCAVKPRIGSRASPVASAPSSMRPAGAISASAARNESSVRERATGHARGALHPDRLEHERELAAVAPGELVQLQALEEVDVVRDERDLVRRQARLRQGLGGGNLDGPVARADEDGFALDQPRRRGDADAGRARVVAFVVLPPPKLAPVGVDEHRVALPEIKVLPLQGGLEILNRGSRTRRAGSRRP